MATIATAAERASETGKKLVVLTGTEDGGTIASYNSQENAVIAIAADELGNGHIAIINKEVKLLVRLGGTEEGGEILTYDNRDKKTVQLIGRVTTHVLA